MGRVLPFLIVLVATILALIDCIAADRRQVRSLPKTLWVLIILLFPVLGALGWFFAGRPASATKRAGHPSAGGRRTPPKPLAPDDDPDFLRGIDTSQSRKDAELLRSWEEDLKRREEDQ